jgi:hypothetical protein
MKMFEAIAPAAGAIGAAAPGTPQRLWEETAAWASKFATNAMSRWLPYYASGTDCAVPAMQGGVPLPCTNHAIGLCDSCLKPVCLHHARVDQHGGASCYSCIVRMIHAQRGQGHAPPTDAHQAGQQRAVPAEIAKRSLAVLGLKPGASWEEIRKAHRKLAARFHPDRVKTETAKRAAAEKCVQVNAALADLERIKYEAAA